MSDSPELAALRAEVERRVMLFSDAAILAARARSSASMEARSQVFRQRRRDVIECVDDAVALGRQLEQEGR